MIVLSIVIPCLNEKDTIKACVADAKRNGGKYFNGKYEIVVSDNGSDDGTLDILSKIKYVKVVNAPIRGYGAALHWGIMRAKGDYVVTADADLSYPFSNLSKFKKVIDKNADLVLGSRFKGRIEKGAMPPVHQYFGTPFLSWLVRLVYGIPTSDSNSGMRLIKKSFYKKLNMKNSGMEWDSELLLKTANHNAKYLEVPIVLKKDKRKKSPHLSTWSDGWRNFKTIFLLKPSTIYPFLIIFPAIAIYFFNISFGLTFLFLDLTAVLILSLLTLSLLESVIEGTDTKISIFLKRFALVPLTGMFAFFVCVIIIFIPDEHLGTKLFFVSVLSITMMWIFLIETIKTHLINRLPGL
jgi:glycosyltransferase involved in cell wall biosynthesis